MLLFFVFLANFTSATFPWWWHIEANVYMRYRTILCHYRLQFPYTEPSLWNGQPDLNFTNLSRTTQSQRCLLIFFYLKFEITLIARFVGPTRGPSWADRIQVGPMLAPWILLSGIFISPEISKYPQIMYQMTFSYIRIVTVTNLIPR